MPAPSPRALAAHASACERGEHGYMDPDLGLFVFTSVYLRLTGRCCGNTCRHCPFDAGEQELAGRRPGAPAWPHPPVEGRAG